MTSTRLLLAMVLIVPTVFAQHRGGPGGGFGHSAAPVRVGPSPVRSMRFGGVRGRNRFARGSFGYGLGYGGSYYPTWDYGLSPLDYGESFESPYLQYSSAGDVLPVPLAPEMVHTPPPAHASSVIHEYNFGLQATTRPGERPTLTIVLKDGSTREAEASWVAGGKLHYVDLQSQQQVLLPAVIDRNATERANEAKNLSLDLPPG